LFPSVIIITPATLAPTGNVFPQSSFSTRDYMYENESVSDLVTIVSVAVLADDDEYDYYLMKVSKVPFQLERVENDDWGNTFPVQNPFKYELVRRRVAIVYSVAIRYVTDIEPRDSISVRECVHEDILENMES
jgi:DNA-binding helix-hairpin-helix protein with protein kinase domain